MSDNPTIYDKEKSIIALDSNDDIIGHDVHGTFTDRLTTKLKNDYVKAVEEETGVKVHGLEVVIAWHRKGGGGRSFASGHKFDIYRPNRKGNWEKVDSKVRTSK